MYEYRAICTRLIGPLTLQLNVDLGFHVDIHATVRLDSLTQPTREQRDKTIATVIDWLAAHESFLVQTYDNKREKFGRYLAVLVGDDGTVLNRVLLDAGLVEPYGAGDHEAPGSHEEEAEVSSA